MFTNETTSFILRCVRKTIWMLLVLWGITLVSFFVIHLAPGTPTDMQTTLNPLAGEAARARLERFMGSIVLCTSNISTGCRGSYSSISETPCPAMPAPL